ncbi:MAG TPA: tripartite tricarboxylate transporter substrate binding protein [Burkholderiales bacterium]|nr:tripartite tricarboxylate transporter substrate binding protein [Burkholderiales bacterium]
MLLHTLAPALIAAALIASGGAHAQQKYPVKPVRLVLPFAAGSAVDVLARLYAQRMSESWGQQVLVDNRTGANGIIGTEIAAKAPPDGYTVGMGNIATLAINPGLYQKLPYEVQRDFAPVSLAATISNCLVVHPSLPVKSVKELVALAKRRPGALNYASGGVGSAQHIPMELLKAMTGINIVHIAYKGLTPAFNDVLAGQVPMMVSGVVTALPHHRSGRLRILATTGTRRTSATPEIPTVAESGLPGYEADSWTGFLVPKGTPPDIVSRLNAEVVRVSQLPDTRERLVAVGFEVVGSTPEAFAALIRNDTARLGKVIRDAGIKAE